MNRQGLQPHPRVFFFFGHIQTFKQKTTKLISSDSLLLTFRSWPSNVTPRIPASQRGRVERCGYAQRKNRFVRLYIRFEIGPPHGGFRYLGS